jgi:multiple sugar transport system substrate-binding protein
MFTWQKDLIDFYGEQNLANFVAEGQAHEWASSNDFEIGRTAMAYDGEWRVAFIKAEHPELNFGTAPAPVGEGASDMFGSSLIGGNVVGIPRGAAHPAEAWLLIKYLATNTDVLVYLTNALKNLPTTTAALNSPDLQLEPQFKMFFDVFSNPNSTFSPILASGSGYQDPMLSFGESWQAAKVPDLQQSLQQVAQQTDDMLSLG